MTTADIKCKGSFWLIYEIPWVIAYFVIYNESDQVCGDTMRKYAQFAQWSFLAQFLLIFVSIPINYRVIRRSEIDGGSRLKPLVNVLGVLFFLLLIATWVYACVALAKRDDCPHDSLVKLVWATVLTPASLVLCCCSCCALIYSTGFNVFKRDRSIGGHFGEARYSGNKDVMSQLNRMQKNLESQLRASNQKPQRLDSKV